MSTTQSENDRWPIAFGSILGGNSEGRAWGAAIGQLDIAADSLRDGVETPLRVNVVFFVDGPTRPNDFTGVRTGSYLRKKNLLIVQAAIYPNLGDDKHAVLSVLLHEAVDVAEQFARQKGIAEALPELRSIVGRLSALELPPIRPPNKKSDLSKSPSQLSDLDLTRVPGAEEWSVRLETESGQSMDDPSEDGILLFLEDIERGDERYVIVSRLRDAYGQTYVQTIRNNDGSYTVERREGTAETHFTTRVDDVRDAHMLITKWAYGFPEAVPEVVWHRLVKIDDADGNSAWEIVP